MLSIRAYCPDDCEKLAELFYQTVHTVNARDYTKEQLDAWATGTVDLVQWNASFLKHQTLVAVWEGRIVGFGDMDASGYLDRLYVHKDHQGKGVAAAICDRLEQETLADTIVSHVSITAKPLFLKRGYVVKQEQHVVRNGVSLTNYVMEKIKKKT